MSYAMYKQNIFGSPTLAGTFSPGNTSPRTPDIEYLFHKPR